MKPSKVTSAAISLAVAALLLSGCTPSPSPDANKVNQKINDDGCTSVVVATSSEKVNLMDDLGAAFKESPEGKSLSKCATVYPINVASGKATDILSKNPAAWPNLDESYFPTVWSPASTIWTDRVAAAGSANVVAGAASFTSTPVVFGMPESMAKVLGYPDKQVSIKEIQKLIAAPDGWGSVGKGLWGSFKIAKNNPNTSTTGLSTILMQSYANSGKTKDLTPADVAGAEAFSKSFESGAIHYGDTTGNVLKTLYNNTNNGDNSNYVSLIALEETSLINYNKGNPDSHTVQPGETLNPPKEKLVAFYPAEGSMQSDNPAVVLGSAWVTPEKKAAGEAFVKFLSTKPAQEILPKYGFRPNDKSVDTAKYLNSESGVNPKLPTAILPKPSVETVSAALDQWSVIRKPNGVLQLIDISGSMDQPIGDGRTRLEGAIDGAKSNLGNFRRTDEVGVWAFTTGISSPLGENLYSVRDFGALNGDKEKTSTGIEDLKNSRRAGTPLYDSLSTAYDFMKNHAEEGRINAIVLLSDGDDTDSKTSLNSLLVKINSSAKEGGNKSPVRIFTIAYGKDVDKSALQKISDASGGQMFDASDASRIDEIFKQVMNNF
jgi:Ca-activated chloride channel family protein